MAGPFSIQYSLALIKVRDGAYKERVGRRRLVRVYLGWGRLCPAVPVPAGEGAALTHAADHEQEEEDQGGDGGHQDVQPALRPQLGPAAGEAREEQHVVIPVSAAQVIPTMHEGCIKKKQNCYNAPPVTREVSEVLVVARVAVGRGGVTLAVKPAALQRRLLIPDADGAHLRWPQPPSLDNLWQLDSGAHLFWQWSANNDFLWSVHGQTQFHGIPQIDQLCSLNEWSRV